MAFPAPDRLSRDSILPARVDMIGVPRDLGAVRRGVDMGPSAVRYARLREGLVALGVRTLVDQASVHLSFDMDGIDQHEALGVGTPVRGGLTYSEAHLAMEMLAEAGVLGSLEVTEINPILDEGNRTAEFAVELTLSALGKSIL